MAQAMCSRVALCESAVSSARLAGAPGVNGPARRASLLVVRADAGHESRSAAEFQASKLTPVASTMAGAAFSALAAAPPAMSAELVAQIAADDNRALVLLGVVVPALGWVLFNIINPALNQLAKMQGNPTPSFTVKKPATRGTAKRAASIAIAAGSSALLFSPESADAAQEVASLAADNRPLVLLLVVLPALGWVLFNILKPALNQVTKMIGGKKK